MQTDPNRTPTIPSPNRRKLLTAMLGASAVAAMAPQQWTQPVLKRIITPAHGQAFSIAAGLYSVTFREQYIDGVAALPSDEPNEIYLVTIRFFWPGGIDPQEIEYTVTDIVPVQGTESTYEIDEIIVDEVRIALPSDRDLDEEWETTSVSPALPGGLVFLIPED